MAVNFADLIQSHRFTFFVGPEEKAIVVHAAAIAATSPQLDALVNNGMKESEERCARLGDVQVDDFIRFCEYAYRGDYKTPLWEVVVNKVAVNEVPKYEDNGWASFGSPSAKKKSKKGKKYSSALEPLPPDEQPQDYVGTAPHSEEPVTTNVEVCEEDDPWPAHRFRPTKSRTSLRAQLNSRKYQEDGGPKTLILQQFEPQPNEADNQSFAPVFLAHARLFYFAQVRLIAPLKALTLAKLHKTLMGFKLYVKRVGDVIQLARYAFSNPDLPGGSDDGIMDELKTLVMEYIVCEIDTIGDCDEFVELMEEGGAFAGDFWKMIREYVY